MTTSYSDLLAKKAELQRQTEALQKELDQALKAERSGVIAQIKTLMAEHGLTAADLDGKPGKATKVSSAQGSKVAPKYKDPQTGATWSGRGLRPKWLAAALEGGKSLDDFAI